MMKAAKFLSTVLLAPLACFAQMPPTGSYLIYTESVGNDPAAIQRYWDMEGARKVAPTPGVTAIVTGFLWRAPPSTTNQRWSVNLLGSVGGSSGLYSFSSEYSVKAPKLFVGIGASGKAVVTSQETVFNVTVSLKFPNLYTIQPIGTSAPNMALTANPVLDQPITTQPLVQDTGLQLWAFIAI